MPWRNVTSPHDGASPLYVTPIPVLACPSSHLGKKSPDAWNTSDPQINAVNQAAKEISQRFDFKNVDAGIKWSGEAIDMQANTEERVNAVLDVFKDKLVKRQISLKGLEADDPKLSGKVYKINASISAGITQENAKKLSKLIRDEGPKGVKA